MINLFKNYINWHIKNLVKLFTDNLHKKQEDTYVKSLNFIFWFKGINDRIKYKNKENRFIINNSEITFVFENKKQGVHSYKNGLDARAREIGKAYMLNEIDFMENDYIVDCGANVGDLLLYFKHKNIKINYLGIEPSPEEYSCLRINAKDYTHSNIGLWNKKAEKTFYISSDGADSSLITPSTFDSKINIKCDRLDNLLSDNKNVKLLKLEAEGAEPEVLDGASTILRNIEYISADLGPERGVDNLETYSEVTNLLYKNDFSLIKINPDRLSVLYKNNKY